MSSYSKTVDFAAKDSLPSGNASKVVSGTEINTEFSNIETAVNSKANTASPTFTGTATIPAVDINAGNIDGTAIGASSASTALFTTVDATGVISGSTIEADGDTSAGDNAAMGYTAAEGLILTGQGSTNDVTIKNDADADVLKIPTGTTNVNVVGAVGAGTLTAGSGSITDSSGAISFGNENLSTSGTLGAGAITGTSLVIGSATVNEAALEILDGATITTAELNILDGVTSTAAEINILDGVTATASELNALDGITATVAELNILDGVTATATELNLIDGVTSTTDELNILDGVTSTAAELNILDGVTSTAAELNILDGVTSTAAELNILDGVTSTAAELNYTDGVTSAIQTQLNTKAPLADPNFTGTLEVGTLDAASGSITDSSGAISFGNENLSTTGTLASGALDVTGAATVDAVLIEPSDAQVQFNSSAYKIKGGSNYGDIRFEAPRFRFYESNGVALQIDNNDISFYEDTGSTVKLFWDASAESLGIGTTSPDNKLHVNSGTTNTVATFESTDATARIILKDNSGQAQLQCEGDNLVFGNTASGSERVRITSSGNVGIGTSSPEGTLQVENASNNALVLNAPANRYNSVGFQTAGTDKWWLGRADSDQIASDAFFIGTDAGNATDPGGFNAKLVINTSGNVGIGTSSPSATIDVVSSGTNSQSLAEFSSASGLRAKIASDGGDDCYLYLYDTNDANTVSFRTDGNHSFINGGGNFGIGTASPASVLHVYDGGSNTANTITFGNPSATPKGEIHYTAGGSEFLTISAKGTNSSLGNIVFKTGATPDERLRIDPSGNLLVGTTDDQPFNNSAGSSADNGIALKDNGQLQVSSYKATAGSGYVGYFNRTSTDGGIVAFSKDGTTVGTISVTGSATAYNTSSDYRLKEDDVPLSGATERIKALRPINFAWKADGTRVDGFLAHEAQEVVPESVTGTKDGMMDEEYEVTPAVYEDVITPAVEAVEGVEAVEAVEAVDAVYDEEGELVSEAIEAVEAVEGVEAVEAQEETTESVLITEAVMGTRSVPDYQGIDQSKLVPLLTATIQELIARIEALEGA